MAERPARTQVRAPRRQHSLNFGNFANFGIFGIPGIPGIHGVHGNPGITT
jgi:hypothetical protein